MKSIQIQMDSEFKRAGERHNEIKCDDSILFFSFINDAVMGMSQNGDPVYAGNESTWLGGFDNVPDVYTRLYPGGFRMSMNSGNERINRINLVNLIQSLIANGRLSEKMRLSLSEEFINGKEK